MRGRCERAAVSSRVSIVWGAALNRILRMRRDNIVNDNQSLPEKSGLKLRSLSASNGSRALTKVRRAAFNANEQHSPTPTPSAGAADPPHRGEGKNRLISETYTVLQNQTHNPKHKKGGPFGPPFSKPNQQRLTPGSRPAPRSPDRWAPCRQRSSARPWRRNRLTQGRSVRDRPSGAP